VSDNRFCFLLFVNCQNQALALISPSGFAHVDALEVLSEHQVQ
jgi:hypothetical protein